MILKNFFGKTIEAAKKSAQQIYGDDFLLVDSSEPEDGKREARVTVAAGKKESNGSATPQNGTGGVKFERSTPQQESKGLQSLRRIAQEQDATRSSRTNGTAPETQAPHKPDPALFKMDLQQASNGVAKTETASASPLVEEKPQAEKSESASAGTMYSRAQVRTPNQLFKKVSPELEQETIQENSSLISEKPSAGKFITHFRANQVQEQQNGIAPAANTSRQEQREITALHKRFDKLEALLDSSLISANLDYASHPAFQQLVQTGINTSVIAGWFSEIIQEGIDPFEQSEQFMAKLARIIRRALGDAPADEPKKFMLFAGPSGAGKTQLIMKLAMSPDFMLNQKVAVVSVYPQNNQAGHYYTILEAFCSDNDLPYFKVTNNRDLTSVMEEWVDFDHVLIDTPSLSTGKDEAFRDFWKIRQLLSPLAPLEIHYVVNASLNRFYFRNSTAAHHPLQPDYVAITHLDEVNQWGPVIPFLKEMGCGARYISSGQSIPGSIREFDPQWFAQKVLQEN